MVADVNEQLAANVVKLRQALQKLEMQNRDTALRRIPSHPLGRLQRLSSPLNSPKPGKSLPPGPNSLATKEPMYNQVTQLETAPGSNKMFSFKPVIPRRSSSKPIVAVPNAIASKSSHRKSYHPYNSPPSRSRNGTSPRFPRRRGRGSPFSNS